ncbi:hypothetical protein [Reichenbachiella versicolor]|uniref:hypothetical protein n=1 Tax=Reichenbachiella versicolor TaxID=1821036 RepID=UPI000D6DF3E7|nr:hypothetical protein [Reichenbachiella versicolor]
MEPKINYSFRSGFDPRKLDLSKKPHGEPFYITVDYNGEKHKVPSLINNSRAKSNEELQELVERDGSKEVDMIKHIIEIETHNHTQPLPNALLSKIIRDYRYTLIDALALYGISLIRYPWKYFKEIKLEGESTDLFYQMENLFGFNDFLPLSKPQKWKEKKRPSMNQSEEDLLKENIISKYEFEQRELKREKMLDNPYLFLKSIYGVFEALPDVDPESELANQIDSVFQANRFIDIVTEYLSKSNLTRIDNTVYNWFFGGTRIEFAKYFDTQVENDMSTEMQFLILQAAFIPNDFRHNSKLAQHIHHRLDKDGRSLYDKGMVSLSQLI